MAQTIVQPARPARPPPLQSRAGPISWARQHLFNGVHNKILTLLVAWVLLVTLPSFIHWAFIDSVWSAAEPGACRETTGACWAVVAEKHRIILFGTFPYDQHWRALAAIILIVAMGVISGFRSLWSYWLFGAWIVAFAVVMVLMLGGVFGLEPVGTNRWGGLPLTLMLFVGTVVGGLPIAIFLALGRRSELPVIKALSIGVIEITRGVPLITILFMASLMLPLFLPERVTVDKVLRAQLGMIIFFGAYAAEVVRGGLQAIPRGQYEAADALNLTYWQKTRKIILPQALRIVIPGLMNDIIRAFKNTTFVSIIGVFDILGATKAALADPLWVSYAIEAYIFVFVLYFAFCSGMSKYSQSVERWLSKGRNL